MTSRTEEEGEAREKLDGIFVDMEFEDKTGLPAIARQFGAADGVMPADME